MSLISELLVQGGQALTAGQVSEFRHHIAAYKLKAETLELHGQPLLRAQCLFLLRFIEDVLDDAYVTEDFSTVPEAIFAVRYLVKEVDVIPDTIPGGFSDDAALFQELLTEHEAEFRKYCSRDHLDFEKILKPAK